MFCPSCGASLEVDTQIAHLVVCEYCDSSLILDGAAARISGKMAALRPPEGVLYRGASGEARGRRFQVLGRVRYGYSAGFWDEWFLRFEDGTQAWISESERDLTLETCVPGDGLGLTWEDARPGQSIQLGDRGYHVDEKDVATCEGGEGQLPFPIVQGEQVPFLDCSQGPRFATVEFEEGGVRIFHGSRIPRKDLILDVSREEAGVGDTLSGGTVQAEGSRERVVRGEGETLKIKCEQCASPLEVPAGAADSIECAACGHLLDLTKRRVDCPGCEKVLVLRAGDAAKAVVCPRCRRQLDCRTDAVAILAQLKRKDRVRPPLRLGSKGTLRDTEYTVAGFLRWVERDAWGTYVSDEVYLRATDGEDAWLILEDGHVSLSKELDERPENPSTLRRARFTFQDRRWTVFEDVGRRNGPKLTVVDGELPWVARIGDQCGYTDSMCPPFLLSWERSETESEWYLAEYLPREEVLEAFGLEDTDLPQPVGIPPHMPYPDTAFRSQARWVTGLFALIFLFMFVKSFTVGSEVATRRFAFADIRAESYLTEPFSVASPNTLVQAKFHAPVDNSWVYLEGALVDAEDKALLDFSTELSYYHGYDGGESWSEGSQDDSVYFRVDEPGEYRLLLSGEGGQGGWKSPRASLSGNPNLTVTLYSGIELSRWYLLGFLVCLAWSLFEFVRRAMFEGARWGDDDD